jgi:hypothetical protein
MEEDDFFSPDDGDESDEVSGDSKVSELLGDDEDDEDSLYDPNEWND